MTEPDETEEVRIMERQRTALRVAWLVAAVVALAALWGAL